MNIAYIVLLSILSGILYRAGGMGGDGRKKFPKLPSWIFDTKARDIGCGLCTLGAYMIHANNINWFKWPFYTFEAFAILAMLGALSTYWDEV